MPVCTIDCSFKTHFVLNGSLILDSAVWNFDIVGFQTR